MHSLLGRQFTVAFATMCGVLVMVWGLPRAKRYRLPWRWRVGILYIGLGLVFWPPFYFFFGHLDLEMVWIPIWGATFLTFAVGIRRLRWANKFEPGGSFRHPYDLGWLMRPRPARSPATTEGLLRDTIEDFVEDQSNPLAPILRYERRHKQNAPDQNTD
jgi:hypothetical protein